MDEPRNVHYSGKWIRVDSIEQDNPPVENELGDGGEFSSV